MIKLFIRRIGIPLFSVVFILIVWQTTAWIVQYSRNVDFPSPFETFSQFVKTLIGDRSLYDFSLFEHTLASLVRWLIGYIIAVFAGIISGVILGMNRFLNKLILPFVNTLQLIPGLAWIPVSLLLFGLGNVSTIFMISIIALTPIIITTATGIKNTPPDLIHAAEIMGAGRRALFFHVLLPASLFNIIDGMRIGLANSWRVLIAAEMIVGSGLGLGYVIIQSRWSLDYTAAFVAIIVIVLIGLSTERLIFMPMENSLRKKYGFGQSSDHIQAEL